MARMTIAEKSDAFPTQTFDSGGPGFWAGPPTDHWVLFLRRARSRVLEVPHTIGLGQTSFAPVAERPILFTVPGTSYEERRRLYGFTSTRQRLRQLAHKIQDRFYFARHESLTARKLSQLHVRYDADIARSRSAYVSGSVHRTPVRKYFEVPALGAMPIGQRCESFDDLGFRDGENFVVAETPREVATVLAQFDCSAAERIVSSARRLIIGRHSEAARGRQLAKSLQLIVDGVFAGSQWRAGEYTHAAVTEGAESWIDG